MLKKRETESVKMYYMCRSTYVDLGKPFCGEEARKSGKRRESRKGAGTDGRARGGAGSRPNGALVGRRSGSGLRLRGAVRA